MKQSDLQGVGPSSRAAASGIDGEQPTARETASPTSAAQSVQEPFRRNANRVREVYFIRAKALGLIKIGVANHTLPRLVAMQTDCPDDLELLGVLICDRRGVLELELHRAFGAHRVRGEWFQPTPELLDFIARHAKDFGAAGRDRIAADLGPLPRLELPEEPKAAPLPKIRVRQDMRDLCRKAARGLA